MNATVNGMTIIQNSDAWTVSLRGELDYVAAMELLPQLSDVVDKCNTDLLLDLSNVTLLDSEGIKALLVVYRQMREKDGNMRVINCSEMAFRVLHLVGVDQVFEIAGS